MVEPPVLTGGVNATLAWPALGVATTAVGLPGACAGVTEPDGSDGSEVPTLFVALTVKV